MKKTFRIQNLCCGHCASKIESKIKELDFVNDCRLNFMTLRLSIDIVDGHEDQVVAQAKQIATRIEPNIQIG